MKFSNSVIDFNTMVMCAFRSTLYPFVPYGCYCGFGGYGIPMDPIDTYAIKYSIILYISVYKQDRNLKNVNNCCELHPSDHPRVDLACIMEE